MNRGRDSIPRSFRRLKNITYGMTFTEQLAKHLAATELGKIVAAKKMKKTGWFAEPHVSLPAIHVPTEKL